MLLFGFVYAPPNKGITILDSSFINDNSAFSQSSISEVEFWAKVKINRFSYDTVHLRNEFNFWNVHGIMNTSGTRVPEVFVIP